MLDPAGVYHPQGIYRGGPAKCSEPFGAGTYSGTYRDKVPWPNAVENGSSKLKFDGGTVRGSYRLSGKFQTTYHGVMHILGGTGRFKHVTGTLRLTCTKDIPNVRCKGSGTVTGI